MTKSFEKSGRHPAMLGQIKQLDVNRAQRLGQFRLIHEVLRQQIVNNVILAVLSVVTVRFVRVAMILRLLPVFLFLDLLSFQLGGLATLRSGLLRQPLRDAGTRQRFALHLTPPSPLLPLLLPRLALEAHLLLKMLPLLCHVKVPQHPLRPLCDACWHGVQPRHGLLVLCGGCHRGSFHDFSGTRLCWDPSQGSRSDQRRPRLHWQAPHVGEHARVVQLAPSRGDARRIMLPRCRHCGKKTA
mmetsp:Transcript_48327/g.103237  ORF Transcript_48327/g.103237 Transcript_48327/m.103237 type:complete len:242 (+) Transcript_48327:959-1684(+)